MKDFLQSFKKAQAKRRELPSITEAYRLFHGAGDGLAGIEIDVYGAHAVCSLHDELQPRQESILDAVFALGFEGVYLKLRPKRANTLVATRRSDVAPLKAVRGSSAPSPLTVHEWGVPYLTRLGDGLSTGLFLDQRDARGWLLRHSRQKSLLNLFCYHAAFSVAAIQGGAESSISVDASRTALNRAKEGFALVEEGENHRLQKADALQWLAGGKERFDIVVLDPPSYSTTKRGRFRADKDYPKLAAAALSRTKNGGSLLACTNHRGISAKRFDELLQQASMLAKVSLKPMNPIPSPADFPVGKHGESHLKRCLFRVHR